MWASCGAPLGVVRCSLGLTGMRCSFLHIPFTYPFYTSLLHMPTRAIRLCAAFRLRFDSGETALKQFSLLFVPSPPRPIILYLMHFRSSV